MSSERRAMGRPALLRPASPLRPARRLWSWLPASLLGLATALTMAAGCRPGTAAGRPASPPAPIGSTGYEFAGWYEPARDLGPLFRDVQLSGIFADSKTFADARPLRDPAGIVARYAATRGSTGFSLRAFVEAQFELPRPAGEGFRADSAGTMEAHIGALWPVLTRAPSDQPRGHGSLIRLPHPYVVPGGRFREVYYWDSYFTMLGLVESGRTALVQSMLDNFAWLVGRIGHIPNGNRTYYLGRSQPPYFAAMVGLYARAADTTRALRYLRALEAEHRFWMDGAERLAPGQAYRRVVRLPDGSVLNRYWDDLPEPRPESYRPDDEVGQTLPPDRREAFFRNVRATAESGWDFSSRWMRDPKDLRTLETVELLPVDLNSLLYHAERTIAALRTFRGRKGDAEVARRFAEAAERRRRSLLAAAWDPQGGFFYDVRWRTDERVSDRPTLAAAAPLYFGLATEEQGRTVARQLERAFLKPGGFVTTLVASGQQWDAPNGWPPLEWLAIEGVRRYGSAGLADTAAARWLALNRRTWRATGRMMEKYDVEDLSRGAGGGEYPTQDGFGWTNGVALALGAQRASGTPRGDADRKAGKPRHQIERAAEGGDVGPERAHPGIAAALQSGDFGLGGLQPARQCCLGNPAEAPEAPQGFLRGERQPAQAALGQSPADLLLEPLLVSRPFRLLAPHPLLHPNPRLSGFPFSWTLVLSNH